MISRQLLSVIILSFVLGGIIFPSIQYVITIKPLESKFDKMQSELDKTQIELDKTLTELDKVQNRVIELKDMVDKEIQIYSYRYGLNYYSTNWRYEAKYLPDSTIRRDFNLFQREGVSNITLAIVWPTIESQKGTYDDDRLKDIIRVCKIAQQYNLSVTIDFHTLMHDNSFTIPSWVTPKTFETVIKDPITRQSWLNFINHCVSQLKEVTNISSWEMMNEPAIADWAAEVTITDFTQLWREMRSIIKSYSNKPISIRFGGDSLGAQFNYDPSIGEICDFISINYYEEYSNLNSLKYAIQHYNGKKIVISEFGLNSNNDAVQAYKIMEMVKLFQEIKISEWNAFMWRADQNYGVPELPGEGYNLALNENGDPRVAFYFLKPQYDIGLMQNIINQINK
jgi:hypothetical protein